MSALLVPFCFEHDCRPGECADIHKEREQAEAMEERRNLLAGQDAHSCVHPLRSHSCHCATGEDHDQSEWVDPMEVPKTPVT